MEIKINKTDIKRVENDGTVYINIDENKLKKILNTKKLGRCRSGDVVQVGDKYNLIVLEHLKNGTAVLFKDCLLKTMYFNKNTSDYAKSEIRAFLNTEFIKEFQSVVGKENLVPHVVDLSAYNGHYCYGTVIDNISLLTTKMYNRYRYIIGADLNDVWWLATAFSDNKDDPFVCAVFDHGVLNFADCCDMESVRPFCILSSDLTVSVVDD